MPSLDTQQSNLTAYHLPCRVLELHPECLGGAREGRLLRASWGLHRSGGVATVQGQPRGPRTGSETSRDAITKITSQGFFESWLVLDGVVTDSHVHILFK